MEPLAIRILSSPLIRGLPINDIEERISLYADDTLVYLADPHDSLTKLSSTHLATSPELGQVNPLSPRSSSYLGDQTGLQTANSHLIQVPRSYNLAAIIPLYNQ